MIFNKLLRITDITWVNLCRLALNRVGNLCGCGIYRDPHSILRPPGEFWEAVEKLGFQLVARWYLNVFRKLKPHALILYISYIIHTQYVQHLLGNIVPPGPGFDPQKEATISQMFSRNFNPKLGSRISFVYAPQVMMILVA